MSHDHHEPQGIGSATNKAFAQDYWFIVAGVVGLGVAVRVVNHIEAKSRCAVKQSSDGTGLRANAHT